MSIVANTRVVVTLSGSNTVIFLSLDVAFVDFIFSLEISEKTCILFSTILTRNNVNDTGDVTKQATSSTVHS